MANYLGPDELAELTGPDGLIVTLRHLAVEQVDGRPQLVMYVHEDPRGIVIHRKLYEDLTRFWGHNEFADLFFQTHGLQ